MPNCLPLMTDLYTYDIPKQTLDLLELMVFDSWMAEVPVAQESKENHPPKEKENDKNRCQKCNILLIGSDAERRNHYKGDFHRYNLKRGTEGLPPLSEEEFENILEQGSMESISGSDSDSDYDSQFEKSKSPTPKLTDMVEKLGLDNMETSSVSHLNTRSPYIYFKSHQLPQDKVYAVYKALFSDKDLTEDPKEALKRWSSPPYKNGKSALLMIGGGHFAGAIVSHTRKNVHGNAPNSKISKEEQAVELLANKSFHRYTTRRKQGGSQSASDNARGKANSAGSSIRRYNEQALIQEVRALLTSWRGMLQECDNIFIRANGASTRGILVGYEGAPLKSSDPRIHSFPFTTKRATTSELKNAWAKLTTISIQDVPKSDERSRQRLQQQLDSLSKSTTKTTKVREEESKEVQSTNEIISLLKRSKAPLLISYLKKNSILPNFELEPKANFKHYPTPLHYASAHGYTHMIQVLLVTLKADPTIVNEFGKNPADLSANASTRRAFQIARNSLGESYCDWKNASVGSPMSREDVAKEEAAEEMKQKTEKRQLIEESLAKKTELEMKKPSIQSNGTVGGSKILTAAADLNALTPEQKMRVMREQRARAAEARLKGK